MVDGLGSGKYLPTSGGTGGECRLKPSTIRCLI